MIKYFCDKCGKEINSDNLIVVKLEDKCTWKLPQDLFNYKFHFCKFCAEQIVKEIK